MPRSTDEEVAHDGGAEQGDNSPEHGPLAAQLVLQRGQFRRLRVELGLEAGNEVRSSHVSNPLDCSLRYKLLRPSLAKGLVDRQVVGIDR